jgi:mono/diheme cytochrome c family protein
MKTATFSSIFLLAAFASATAALAGPGYGTVYQQVFGPSCINCHQQSNAKHGVRLDDYADALSALARIETEVFESGEMPPDGSLTDGQQQLLKAWIDAGGPENDS